FTVGVTATFAVTVIDNPGLSVTESGALPTGVMFNAATNTMAGSPAQGTAGTYPLVFTAAGTNGTVTQAFTLTVDQAQFTYPTNGQVAVDTAEPFTWSTIPQAQGYLVTVGSRLYAADLGDSGVLAPSTTSWPIPAVAAGRTVYAELLTEVDGTWTSYQAISFIAGAGQATFAYPAAGQSGVDPTRPISWATVAGAQAYILVVGTKPGSANIANSGVLGAAVSTFRPTLPAATTLYATLFTEVAGGWGRYQSITFTTSAAQAAFIAPVNGQVGLVRASTFTWTAVYAAQAYLLTVGTAPFGTNVVNSGLLAPGTTSRAVTLPAATTLYGTLYTEVGGKWAYQRIVFTTGH
ncbi:MAG: putative Ig domain-containing protein, partial [Acidimicrobiales bacterium]